MNIDKRIITAVIIFGVIAMVAGGCGVKLTELSSTLSAFQADVETVAADLRTGTSEQEQQFAEFLEDFSDKVDEDVVPILDQAAAVQAEAASEEDALFGLFEMGASAFGFGGLAAALRTIAQRRREEEARILAEQRTAAIVKTLEKGQVTVDERTLGFLDPEVAQAVMTPGIVTGD